MELNRSNMKKIMLLIAFAVGLLVGLQHVDILVSIIYCYAILCQQYTDLKGGMLLCAAPPPAAAV